jgi:hypothetical protein
MKATIDVPDELYRKMKAKSALEGRALREVAIELFGGYVGSTTVSHLPASPSSPRLPTWFGRLRPPAGSVVDDDLESVRRSIAAGVMKERGQ